MKGAETGNAAAESAASNPLQQTEFHCHLLVKVAYHSEIP